MQTADGGNREFARCRAGESTLSTKVTVLNLAVNIAFSHTTPQQTDYGAQIRHNGGVYVDENDIPRINFGRRDNILHRKKPNHDTILPDGESNPALARDRRVYSTDIRPGISY